MDVTVGPNGGEKRKRNNIKVQMDHVCRARDCAAGADFWCGLCERMVWATTQPEEHVLCKVW